MCQIPLSDSSFGEAACREGIAGKEKMWEEQGYGPWAFVTKTILLPPRRTRLNGMFRLGFQPYGEVEVAGEQFIRYRLNALESET